MRSSGAIPKGYGFDLVTCPNYFFEILAWSAVAALSSSWVGAYLLLLLTRRCFLARANVMGDSLVVRWRVFVPDGRVGDQEAQGVQEGVRDGVPAGSEGARAVHILKLYRRRWRKPLVCEIDRTLHYAMQIFWTGTGASPALARAGCPGDVATP